MDLEVEVIHSRGHFNLCGSNSPPLAAKQKTLDLINTPPLRAWRLHRKVKLGMSPGSLIFGLILPIAHLCRATLWVTARLADNDNYKKWDAINICG